MIFSPYLYIDQYVCNIVIMHAPQLGAVARVFAGKGGKGPGPAMKASTFSRSIRLLLNVVLKTPNLKL